MEKITAGLQLALDSGRVACTEYSAIETLAIKAFIHQASKGLLEESHSTDFHPVNNGNLRVTINPSKVMEMVSTLGNVISVSPYPPLCSLVGVNITFSVQFLRAFLKWNEYPPDASHGFYVKYEKF